jgi:hypothetical protein
MLLAPTAISGRLSGFSLSVRLRRLNEYLDAPG